MHVTRHVVDYITHQPKQGAQQQQTAHHDAVVVGQQAAMAVTEVQAPNLEGLVRRAGRQQSPVVGDVHGHHRQLVAVQGQEKLERVIVKHLDGAVQNGN